MIAQCSTCSKTFEVRDTGAQFCPHCGTHVYIEAPGQAAQGQGFQPDEPPSWTGGGEPLGDHAGGGSQPPPGPAGWPPGAGSPGGGEPPRPGEDRSPFERRADVGFATGFVQTVKLAFFDPRRLFGSMRVDDAEGAFLFGWLCLTIGSLAGNLWNHLSGRFTGPTFGPDDFADLPPEMAELVERFVAGATGPGNLLISLVLTPVFAAIGLLIMAALVHVGTLIFGANNRGWNANFRAVCYGSAPMLVGVVPFCGSFIGTIWTVVLTIVGVVFLQRTSAGKATLSVLIWMILLCCCACAVSIAIGAAMGAALG